jgi:UDP-N-acetylglucosamine 4-epimerase
MILCVLVTAAAGFIGSNFCDALLKDNYQVVCLDKFSTGHIKNLTTALENKKFQLVEGAI